ncbi:MAG: hypothetical protein AB7F61_16065 [Desulfobulbus sp.]
MIVELGTTLRTIYRWRKRFIEHGSKVLSIVPVAAAQKADRCNSQRSFADVSLVYSS